MIRVACHDALVELSPKEDARTSDIASRGSTALRHWIEMSRVARVSRWSYRACHTSSTLDTSVSVVDGDKPMYREDKEICIMQQVYQATKEGPVNLASTASPWRSTWCRQPRSV